MENNLERNCQVMQSHAYTYIYIYDKYIYVYTYRKSRKK